MRSTNFTVVGDASERQIRLVAQQLEQFREVMLRALPAASAASPVPIVVIVFANDRSFGPFKPRFQGRPVEVAGFFQGGQDVNFMQHASGHSGLGERRPRGTLRNLRGA